MTESFRSEGLADQVGSPAAIRPVRKLGPAVRNPALVSAGVVGVLDVSIGFSYLLGVQIAGWYAATLGVKLALVLLLRAPGWRVVRFHRVALLAFASLTTASCVFHSAPPPVWLAAFGFFSHLVLTLACVKSNQARAYVAAVAYAGFVMAALYDILALLGKIEVVSGRYLFFGGSHPNLGGEILAIVVMAGAMSLKLVRCVLVLAASVIADLLMQGRAALLVMLLVLALRLCVELIRTSKRHLPLAIASIGVSACALLLSSAVLQLIQAGAENAFLLNDAYRGTGTGFVGRSDRWHAAWEAFMAKPIFGQGFGYYVQTGLESAHNFYMYALVEFGMTSCLLFAFGAFCLWRMARLDVKLFLIYSPIFVLTIFNDRFIDLNPYPFIMFTIVMILASSGARGLDGWFGKAVEQPRGTI